MKKRGKAHKTKTREPILNKTKPSRWHISLDRRLVIIAVLIFLLTVLVVSWIGIKINFLARNELYISIEPHQQLINADYDKPIELNFTLKNRNFWFCPTYCQLALYNPYEEKLLAAENVSLSPNTEIYRSYNILLNTRGAGQRIYYFEAECNNKWTVLCQTDQKKYLGSCFVAINYHLPESESMLRDTLKDTLNIFSQRVEIAGNLIEENRQIAEDISKQRPVTLNMESWEEIVKASSELLETSHDLWVQDKYSELNQFVSAADLKEIQGAVTMLQLIKDNLVEYAEAYNMQAMVFNEFQSNWAQLSDAYGFYLRTNNTPHANAILNLSERIMAAHTLFTQMPFEDFNNQSHIVRNLNTSFFDIEKKYVSDRDALEKNSTNLINTHAKIQAKVFAILGSGEVTLTQDMCADLRHIADNYNHINANAEARMQGFTQYADNTEFTTLRDAHKRSMTDDSFNVVYENATNQFIINHSIAIENTLNLTAKDYVSVLSFNEPSQLDALEAMWCRSVNETLLSPFEEHALSPITITPYTSEALINITFQDNPPRCCIFGLCSDCSVNEKLYPTIFLHGHSSLENNPVEESLVAFSNIQKKMGYEDELINAGGIDTSTAALAETWSRMNAAITLRASYYYITYYDVGVAAASVRKSESIENYAIRLKELIEMVKSNTGASKVNLVTHSMGGLVAREYITLFGEESVDKLILIGTPNKGISGRARQFCSTIGSDNECEDMFNDSIFIKRLNAQTNIPKKVKVYTIYGTGCNTEGKDGDGILAAGDVMLDYAENFQVNGTCKDLLGLELHSDMLDPEIHPEVYDKIVEILKN